MTIDTASSTPVADTPASAPAVAPAPAAPASTETSASAPAPTETPAAVAPQGAPEKYEFKPVEGVKLDDAVLAKYGEVAKSLNLPQDQAQRVISEVAPLIAQQQAAAFKATVEGWEAQTKADKDIGGDKLAENLSLAKKGMDAYFAPEFVKLLNDTGLGNHPDMVRGLMKIGKTVSQDSFVAGGSNANAGKTAADVLYPGSR